MAGVNELEKRIDRLEVLPAKVATLEERTGPRDGSSLRNTLIGVIAAGLLTGTGWWVYWVTTSLTAIKQHIQDGGNTALVAQLRSPYSPEELRANLLTVSAQLARARVEHSSANPAKVRALAGALNSVLKKTPSVPEAWQTAAQLVSFRTGTAGFHGGQPLCDVHAKMSASNTTIMLLPAVGRQFSIPVRIFEHCTLRIEDLIASDWDDGNNAVTLSPLPGSEEFPNTTFKGRVPLLVKDGSIVLSANKLPNGVLIILDHTYVDATELNSEPSPPVQQLILAGLSSPDASQINPQTQPSNS